jgi:hypothetical protein
MTGLALILALAAVYVIGYARGAYVMMRCKEGNCPFPGCENHRKNSS